MGNGQDGEYAGRLAQEISESAPEVTGVHDEALYCPRCLDTYEDIRARVDESEGLEYDPTSFDPRAKTFVVPDTDSPGAVRAFLNGGEFEGRLEVRCPDHNETFMTYEGTITRYDDVFVPADLIRF